MKIRDTKKFMEEKRSELFSQMFTTMEDMVYEFENANNVNLDKEDLEEAFEFFIIHNFN